ncbi:MAG: anthranilate synthase component I family protein [Spirochaetes bacterium]|nr:anthranilate synthase component I family protein [Spirochaetota bacterium]
MRSNTMSGADCVNPGCVFMAELMITPGRADFLSAANSYTLVPVFSEIRADFETALSVFLKCKGDCLLESVEGGSHVGRYSIVSCGSIDRFTVRGQKLVRSRPGVEDIQEQADFSEILGRIRGWFSAYVCPEIAGLPPFWGGAIGFLGYEAVRWFEDIPLREEYSSIPDAVLNIPRVVLVLDSVRRSLFIIVSTVLQPDAAQNSAAYTEACALINHYTELVSGYLPVQDLSAGGAGSAAGDSLITAGISSDSDAVDYCARVRQCQQFIRDGEAIQIVLSRKYRATMPKDGFAVYRTLRSLNPSPYLFYLRYDSLQLIGSSPEVMVQLRDGQVLVKPIAGTRRRGASAAEDAALARELLADAKERAEHLMLVDLARNDVGRIALPASVQVGDFMTVEQYSHVMHLVSTVYGGLREGLDAFDVIQAVFPAGTLTGAPKIRAMQLIAGLEKMRRGPYGGMVLNLGFNGSLDSCITIRTICAEGDVAWVQAGAGIVADSIPESEFRETEDKAAALLKALQMANAGAAI